MPTCLCEWVFVPVCAASLPVCGCVCGHPACLCVWVFVPACVWVASMPVYVCARVASQPACVAYLCAASLPVCVCVRARPVCVCVCVCVRMRPAYLDQRVALIRDLATSKYTSPQSQFGTYPCFWSYQWGQRALQQFQWKCFFGARPVSAKIAPSYFPPKTT